MISEVNTLESTALRPAVRLRNASAIETIDNVESEISRLTWAVLDGSASPTDRSQLADLVRSQHTRRHKAPA